eukprot:tig00021073_g18057.t1
MEDGKKSTEGADAPKFTRRIAAPPAAERTLQELEAPTSTIVSERSHARADSASGSQDVSAVPSVSAAVTAAEVVGAGPSHPNAPEAVPGPSGCIRPVPSDPNDRAERGMSPSRAPDAADAAAEADAAPAPPPPAPPGRTLQLMIESHVASGSKRTRVVRISPEGRVGDLLAALRAADGLPAHVAGLQRIFGGPRTLSAEDGYLRLADVGISEGLQRILRHSLVSARFGDLRRVPGQLQPAPPRPPRAEAGAGPPEPPPPAPPGRTLQLMIESHVASGSKRTRVVRISSEGRVGDLFAALRAAEGLPHFSAGVQRLWGGPRTLSAGDAHLSLADAGIHEGLQRTLRHFLAATTAPGRAEAPELREHLADEEPLPRSLERTRAFLHDLYRAQLQRGVSPCGESAMANSLLRASAKGDHYAALALALHGADWSARDPATGLVAPALLASRMPGEANPQKLVKTLCSALEALGELRRFTFHQSLRLSHTDANRFVLDVLRAAGLWRDLPIGTPEALAEAQRVSGLCQRHTYWRRFGARLLLEGPSHVLHPHLVAFLAIQSTCTPRERSNASFVLRGLGPTAVVILFGLLEVLPAVARAAPAAPADSTGAQRPRIPPGTAGGARRRALTDLLLEQHETVFALPEVAEALLAAASRAVAEPGAPTPREAAADADGSRSSLGLLLPFLLRSSHAGVQAFLASGRAARHTGPLLPAALLAYLSEAWEAAPLVALLRGHAPTRAALAVAAFPAAAAALTVVTSELLRFASCAASASGAGAEEEEEAGRPLAVQPAAELTLRLLDRERAAGGALDFRPEAGAHGQGGDEEEETRQALAADLSLRLAGAAGAALAGMAPSLRAAFLLSCPALLSTKVRTSDVAAAPAPALMAAPAAQPADFVWRGIFSLCAEALLAGRAFVGSAFAAAVGRVPGALSPHLRREAVLAEHVVGPGFDSEEGDTLELEVARGSLIDSSIAGLGHELLAAGGDPVSPAELEWRRSVAGLQVTFSGEAAHGPGVQREYLACLARELLDPHAALFRRHDDAAGIYYPSSDARVQPGHLTMFRLCGWAMGAAFAIGSVFPVYFPECLYGYLLGRAPCLEDLASVEPTIARALQRDVLGRDVADLGMVFAVDEIFFGAHRTVPLRPGGEHEPVTDANKEEYVQLAVEYYLVGRVRQELEALREGLRRVLPAAAAGVLLPCELRELVEGRAEVDVADWRRHTRYGNGLSADSQEAAWFWEYVETLPAAGRARLLAFATGSPRAPPGGFAHLVASSGRLEPFQLVAGPDARAEAGAGRLPTSHTCFNQLVLPRYASAGALRAALDAAIGADHGFGFA